jgi:DNA-binding transcriptional MerR regulator
VSKSRDAFRTISEVSDELVTPAHVLRFWESKFSQIKPVKRAGGRRYYRPSDLDLLAGIKKLLHFDGMTIKGAQKLLREHGVKHVTSIGAAALLEGTAAKSIYVKVEDTEPVGIDPIVEQINQLATEISNVVTLPDSLQQGITLPLKTAPKLELNNQKVSTPIEQIEPFSKSNVTTKTVKVFMDNINDTQPRVFHLLQKASHAKLSAQAGAIAPLLKRMQTLRDSINLC